MGRKLDTPLGRQLDAQGRTRKWLASRLRTSPWELSRILAGKPAPDGFWERAALALGVDTSQLLEPADELRDASVKEQAA